MSFVPAMLTPLVLLFPAAGALEVGAELSEAQAQLLDGEANVEVPPEDTLAATQPTVTIRFDDWPAQFASRSYAPESAWQVRIEQRMTIRVAPRQAPVRQNMFDSLPNRAIGPRFEERRIGKCIPVSGIAGVQTNGGNSILLYMRDRRIISASLERACRARDFYSGFYLSSSDDGRLCVDRDALQSRSGANCKLTRIRQLIETQD